MIEPKLIHPVSVVILNPSTSNVVNPVWEEVEGEVKFDSINLLNIKAQVKYYKFAKLTSFSGGFQPLGDGYLLMYTEDAAKLQAGAKITKIGNENVEYYIKESKPVCHYENAVFKKVFFESRKKGKI